MHSILDIDLGYFTLAAKPLDTLEEVLAWARAPMTVVAEDHAEAVLRWKRLARHGLLAPTHVLHVDGHHDMMDTNRKINPVNAMFHVLSLWPRCRMHWMAHDTLDQPDMWLDQAAWTAVCNRFSMGQHRPAAWPTPTVVSIALGSYTGENLRTAALRYVSACHGVHQLHRGVRHRMHSPFCPDRRVRAQCGLDRGSHVETLQGMTPRL